MDTEKIDYPKLFKTLKKNAPKHLPLSPSSSHRWLICSDYLSATLNLPHLESGKAAKRGTLAHELLEQCLLQEVSPEVLSDDIELVDWVSYALDFIETYKVLQPFTKIFSEIFLPWYDVSGGTIDILGISDEEILIADLKTGTWSVEVEDNTQLLNYAIAARSALGPRNLYKLVIIQPSGYHKQGPIREWVITNDRLDIYQKIFEEAIQKNMSLEHGRTAGDHCKWCKAEALCETRANYALEMIELNLRNDFLEK